MKTKLRGQSAFVGAGLDHFMLRNMKRALEPQDLIFAAIHSSLSRGGWPRGKEKYGATVADLPVAFAGQRIAGSAGLPVKKPAAISVRRVIESTTSGWANTHDDSGPQGRLASAVKDCRVAHLAADKSLHIGTHVFLAKLKHRWLRRVCEQVRRL